MAARVLQWFMCLLLVGCSSAVLCTAYAEQRSGVAEEDSPAPYAIQCSAALELMAQAAPSWSSQPVAQDARLIWRNEAHALAARTERDANVEIGQEMGLLAEQAVNSPDTLSRIAAQCLGDVPGAQAGQPNQR